jgi:Sulfotransferase domain
MPTIHLRLATGRGIDFNVAAPGDTAGTCFVLGVRKFGSSVMNSIVIALTKVNGRHFLDVAGRFFEAGVPEQEWRTDPAALRLLVPGQVHGGFRAMPTVFAQSPLWRQARKILLVRDPRDALVSEYFSTAYTHSLPQAQEGEGGLRADFLAQREAARRASVEAFVLAKAEGLNRTMMEFAGAARDPATRLFRYEDVIMKKRDWVRAMEAHFGWPACSEDYLDKVMSWADVVPQEERPDQFIRRVLPGDHKDKLSPKAIARLNRTLALSMRLFGYGE